MPRSLPRAPKFLAALLGAALVGGPAVRQAEATGGHHRGGGFAATGYAPTVYAPTVYAPTALAVPTSYVATAYTPTSLVVPTSYSSVLYPTVYTSTSLVTPTAYVQPTAYLVETGFGSRLRHSALRPTSYLVDPTPTRLLTTTYLPTTYTLDMPVIATPMSTVAYVDDCTGVGSTVAAPPAMTAPAGSSQPPPAGNPPARVESTPRNNPAPAGNAGRPAAEPSYDPDDFPSTPRPDDGDMQLPGFTDPAPGGGQGVASPPDPNASRTSFRPAPTELRPRPALSALGALRGEVLTAGIGGGQPAASVNVVFEDAMKRYPNKVIASDLQGRFEVMLPDGDWRINLEKADGTLTPYSTVTVAAGRFFLEDGRAVSSLRLHQ